MVHVAVADLTATSASLQAMVKKFEGGLEESNLATDNTEEMPRLIVKHDTDKQNANEKNIREMRKLIDDHSDALEVKTTEHEEYMKALMLGSNALTAKNAELTSENVVVLADARATALLALTSLGL